MGLGAGTRVLTHLPWFLLSDVRPTAFPKGVMMGAGWAISLAVAEWAIRSSFDTMHQRRVRPEPTLGQASPKTV